LRHELSVTGTEVRGHHPGEWSLVVSALAGKSNRVRSHWAAGHTRSHCSDQARIDPAAQQNANWHVGDQLQPDSVGQQLAELLHQVFGLRAVAQRGLREAPVAPYAHVIRVD